MKAKFERAHLPYVGVDVGEPNSELIVLSGSGEDVIDRLSDAVDAVSVGGSLKEGLELLERALEGGVGRLGSGVVGNGGSEGSGVDLVVREEVEEVGHGWKREKERGVRRVATSPLRLLLLPHPPQSLSLPSSPFRPSHSPDSPSS